MRQCRRKVVNWRKAPGAIRYLVNARGLQLETLLVSALMYSSETMIWKEERHRVRAVQMDNLGGFLGIGRRYKVMNTQLRELY